MKKFNLRLDRRQIDSAVKALKEYSGSVEQKTVTAIERLMDLGYNVAYANMGGYGQHIIINKTLTSQNGQTEGLFIITDIPITVQWATKNGIMQAEISPMLMAEFGSGKYAEVWQDNATLLNVGRGTFPGQTHAFQDVWCWYDTGGDIHYSSGYKPTHPFYELSMEIIAEYRSVFREVFAEG